MRSDVGHSTARRQRRSLRAKQSEKDLIMIESSRELCCTADGEARGQRERRTNSAIVYTLTVFDAIGQNDATDRQIDALVNELYGLSEDEIRIVEEGTAKP